MVLDLWLGSRPAGSVPRGASAPDGGAEGDHAGSGGGGGGGASITGAGGSGGKAGAWATFTIPITPGMTEIAGTIGTGGQGGAAINGATGGNGGPGMAVFRFYSQKPSSSASVRS